MLYVKYQKRVWEINYFPIMKAFVFGRLNNLEVIVTGYHWLKLGPYLRKEKTKRRYYGYFIFQKTWIGEQIDKRKIRKSEKGGVILEPPVQVMELSAIENKSFEFSEPPSHRNFFAGLNLNRSLTKEIFWELLNDSIKKQLENKKSPCIGVHIRMGDFPSLKPGEDFRACGTGKNSGKIFYRRYSEYPGNSWFFFAGNHIYGWFPSRI